MYSDSIRERQQELLDVLFKKASGRSEATFIKSAGPQLTDDDVSLMRQQLMGKDQRTLAQAQEAKVKKELALKEEYQRLEEEYKRNNPGAKFTDVTKSNLMRNAERNIKDRSVQESYKQMEQAHLRGGMAAFSPTPSAPTTTPAEPIIPSPEQTPLSGEDIIIDDPTSGVEIPDPVDVGEVEFEGDSDGTTIETPTEPATQTPVTTTPTQAPAEPTTQAPTSTPTTTPTTTPVKPATPAPAQTPATPSTTPAGTPSTPQGGSENNGGSGTTNQPPAVHAELDWNKVLKGLIEKLKRHKITGIGGLGGFGLGALIGGGGSFTDRLLWALLGGGAGTGLGYLVEKYLK